MAEAIPCQNGSSTPTFVTSLLNSLIKNCMHIFEVEAGGLKKSSMSRRQTP
jgi:hypothetical protein